MTLNSQGGRVEFHGNDAQYVSTDLLSTSSIDIRKERIESSNLYAKNIQLLQRILGCINNFSKSRILVIGDTIIDQFVACEALGISAEAPVVVVRELANKNFLGAAGIVAAHIKSIGCKCELVSIVGNDDAGKFAQAQNGRNVFRWKVIYRQSHDQPHSRSVIWLTIKSFLG